MSRDDSPNAEVAHWTQDIHQGDAAETLAEMPESSVHCVMTSPPYFGLRDYGKEEQIGLEDSLGEYVQNLVGIGEELRRVLRDDGSWWLNLGDTYGGGSIVRSDGEWTEPGDEGYEEAHTATTDSDGRRSVSKLGRKNKMLVPHRVAIALQEAGWVVRNDVTWVKPNPMPSSVKDRLNTTTEKIFHLVSEPDYWYDLDAIREPYAESYEERAKKGYKHKHGSRRDEYGNPEANHSVGGILSEDGEYGDHMHPGGKNPGDVFEVTTKPFPDAHFAVYPPELCEKPIKTTAPPKVCGECGTPHERDIDREPGEYDYSDRGDQLGAGSGRTQASGTQVDTPTAEFKGWEQVCDCDTDETKPGIVLDPFAGAGTTCLVAKNLARRFVGIDLNPEFVALAQKRVGVTVDEPERLLDGDETALTAYTDGGK